MQSVSLHEKIIVNNPSMCKSPTFNKGALCVDKEKKRKKAKFINPLRQLPGGIEVTFVTTKS